MPHNVHWDYLRLDVGRGVFQACFGLLFCGALGAVLFSGFVNEVLVWFGCWSGSGGCLSFMGVGLASALLIT
jgi:hypothetical protein